MSKIATAQVAVIWLLVMTLAACSPLAATGEPTSAMPPTTAAPPAPLIHPAAGLTYSNAEGLWLIDEQGDPVLLSDQPTGRISPDGRWIAYHSFGEGEAADDIWLVGLTTGERRNLTVTPGRFEWDVAWWPGRPDVIVFGSDVGAGVGEGYPTVVGLDGSGYQVLDEAEGGPLALSPDGQMMAYGGYDHLGKVYSWDRGPELFDPSQYGLAVEKLYRPAWSPDAQYLAWQVGGDLTGAGNWELGIAIFDLEAGTARLLHTYEPAGGGTFPHYLAWSSDGKWLAFVTFAEPPATGRQPNLWAARPDGGEEVYVGAGTEPLWSPDGLRLAYIGAEQEIRLAEAGAWEFEHQALPVNALLLRDWVASWPAVSEP
ncbi:MAG: PD40 domain-containing protein [Anaerolineae bacterium]|nr:PD40 domain-containing protein [Anaerolineae bacterium]